MTAFDPSTLRTVDQGLFGPDSASWQVWTSLSSLIGFQRAVVLEHFDPYLAAAVADADGIYRDPHGRLDRTLAYFLTIATGDSKTCIEASEFLMKVHAKATGVEPISGRRYNANNPSSQLWIHVTGWHSVLKAYEMYGPGPLSPADEDRYWRECVVAAELQTCDPADVPTSRAEVHEYYAKVRPTLCTSERAARGMHYLLRTTGDTAGPLFWATSRMIAPATIATLPKWMRTLGGIDQPAAVDRAIVPAARAMVRALGTRGVGAPIMRQVAPVTTSILAAHAAAGATDTDEVRTPSQARALYGSSGHRSLWHATPAARTDAASAGRAGSPEPAGAVG